MQFRFRCYRTPGLLNGDRGSPFQHRAIHTRLQTTVGLNGFAVGEADSAELSG